MKHFVLILALLCACADVVVTPDAGTDAAPDASASFDASIPPDAEWCCLEITCQDPYPCPGGVVSSGTMAFTGTIVVTAISDRQQLIEGTSLVAGASGLVFLFGQTALAQDAVLTGKFKPVPYGDVTRNQSISVEVLAVDTLIEPLELSYAFGTTTTEPLFTVVNDSATDTPELRIVVKYH